MNQEIYQYIRIAMYLFFGSLLSKWFNNDQISAIIGVIGALITLLWTIYGSRLEPLLDRAKAKSGVEQIVVAVDPTKLKAQQITQSTTQGIKAVAGTTVTKWPPADGLPRSDSEKGSG